MKVAVFGKTLYAGVMSALLAECGHQVYWCDIFQDAAHPLEQQHLSFQDQALSLLLQQQCSKGFLHYCDFSALPLDVDVYLLSLNPTEEAHALTVLGQLQQRPIIHPKLIICL